MPKPGLKVVTVRQSVYERLMALAKSRGQSISQYLEQTLSPNPEGVRTVLGQSQIAQNKTKSLGTSDLMVRPPGFEPGLTANSFNGNGKPLS